MALVGIRDDLAPAQKEVPRMRRSRLMALALTVGALAIPATAAANPDFGPGNSSKGPNDPGAKCHAPGHGTGPGSNEPVPGCKG
jgi:hypothetical protein